MAENGINEKTENALTLMTNRALAEQRLADRKKAKAEIINQEIERRKLKARLKAEQAERRKKSIIKDSIISVVFAIVCGIALVIYKYFL